MNMFGVRFRRKFVINNQAKELSLILPTYSTVEHILLISSSHSFLPQNRRYTVMSIISASLFANIQLETFTNSAFLPSQRLNSLQSQRYILVSSANQQNFI